MRRRRFLGLVGGVVGLAGAVTGCGGGTTSGRTPRREWAAENPVWIPPQLRGTVDRDAVRRFALTLQAGEHAFLPGRPTPTWGVNGGFLGPTLRVHTGERVAMTVRNRLPETTTLHWHGMRLPAAMDGGPHQPIEPGAVWRPTWTVVNDASTSWYHPHPHGATALHVFRGVAGMIIIDDPTSGAAGLPSTYGVDDIPCVVQDRSIDADGGLVFDTAPTFGQLGTDVLVNGTMNAYVPVTTDRVRLRLLNASNARLYHLGLADDRDVDLVANDAGLLPRAVRLNRVSLGPAERAEIVVTVRPGERVVLRSVEGDEQIDDGTFPVLELRAAARLRSSAGTSNGSAAVLGGADAIRPAAGSRVRHFTLQGHDAINGQGMDLTRIDEVVPAGALEIWELENNVYSHNFHVHGVEFSVLDRDGQPPAAYEGGRKDTVHVREKSTVRIAVQFGSDVSATAPYMYHCHILRHEDDGMMGQFVVVDPADVDTTPRTVPPGPVVVPGTHHAGHG